MSSRTRETKIAGRMIPKLAKIFLSQNLGLSWQGGSLYYPNSYYWTAATQEQLVSKKSFVDEKGNEILLRLTKLSITVKEKC